MSGMRDSVQLVPEGVPGNDVKRTATAAAAETAGRSRGTATVRPLRLCVR